LKNNLEAIVKKSKLDIFREFPIISHPVLGPLIGALGFTIGREYLFDYFKIQSKPPSGMLTVYGSYLTLGLIKDYIIDKKKILKEKTIDTILENPRLISLGATLIGGTLGYFGETDSFGYSGAARDFAIVKSATSPGISSEIITRGINTLRKIKRSTKKIKQNLGEKIYNSFIEYPVVPAIFCLYLGIRNENYWRNNWAVVKHKDQIITNNILENIVNYPLEMAASVSRATIDFGVIFGLSLFLGLGLHTNTLKDFYNRGKRDFYRVFKNKPKEIEAQEAVIALSSENNSRIEDTVKLGNLYYESGKVDEAFKNYKKAIRYLSNKSTSYSQRNLILNITGFNRVFRFAEKLGHWKNDEKSNLNLFFIGLLNKDKSAISKIEALVRENPNNANFRYMYGKALEILGHSEQADKEKYYAVEKQFEKSKEKILPGSKNKIILFEDGLLNDIIIAKAGVRSALDYEMKSTIDLNKIIKEYEDFQVPNPICLKEHNSEDYYVMEIVEGDLFSAKIIANESTLDNFYKAADFMGLFHSKIKASNPERDIQYTIIKRFSDLPINELQELNNNLSVLTYSLNGIQTVCNKDAHPRNWMFEGDSLVAIDIEADRNIPITFDTANLTSQYLGLNNKDKTEILEAHLESYNRHSRSKIEMNSKYDVAFRNSIILRTLEIYSQVKDSNKEVKEASLNNSLEAISYLEKEHPFYFRRNKDTYQYLIKTLSNLSSNS
jgi:tetratricopeptide (TPR) repeat protein